MTLIRMSLAEIEANPRRFTDAERRRLEAMTEEEIEVAALADPDNPPWTDEELEQAARERDARLAASRPTREAAAAAHARTITGGEQGDDGLVARSFAETAAHPYPMTEEERARILAMTDEEIEAAALADLDNPPWTDEELEQAVRERDVRLAAAKRSA